MACILQVVVILKMAEPRSAKDYALDVIRKPAKDPESDGPPLPLHLVARFYAVQHSRDDERGLKEAAQSPTTRRSGKRRGQSSRDRAAATAATRRS